MASRLGVSVSTVHRFEGSRLHPPLGENEMRWFDEKQVAALAAELANEPRVRATNSAPQTNRGRTVRCQAEPGCLIWELLVEGV